MNQVLLFLLLFSLLFLGCISPAIDERGIVLRVKAASDMSVFQDKLIVSGSGQISENRIDIKSPYLLTLDINLNVIDSNIFKVETTVSNVLLKPLNKDQCILTYYAAKSLSNQEEISEVKLLNQELEQIKTLSYGHRTRIKDFAVSDNSMFYTLNYERSTQEMSIKSFDNFTENFNVLVNEGGETNIPVSITMLPEKQLAISGIANGFHYLDGHNYTNPLAYGFIRNFNKQGIELKQFNYKHSGHVFFNDMISVEDNLMAVGTKQSEESGMDMLVLHIDEQLNLIWEKSFLKPGIQEASKVISIDESFYILGTSENLNNNRMNLLLICIDNKGNIEWQKSFGGEDSSSSAVEMVYFKSHLIVLSQSKENRISNPDIRLHKISLDGVIQKEIGLN